MDYRKFPIHIMFSGNQEKIIRTLNKINEADAYNEHGDTSLHYFALMGNETIVTHLINCGWDVNIKNEDEATPLTFAILGNHPKIVELLVDAGASRDINFYKCIDKPLHQASRYGSLRIVQTLLTAGFDVNSGDNIEETPLHCAVLHSNHEVSCDIIDALIAAGADVNATDTYGNTALHVRVVHDLNNKKPGSETYTIEEYNESIAYIVKKLLHYGANVDALNKDEKTPLDCVAYRKIFPAAKQLVEAGSNVNFRNAYGDTPLHYAAISVGRITKELIELLLENGAVINTPNINGFTPLDLVVDNRVFSIEIRKLNRERPVLDYDKAIERKLLHEVDHIIDLITLFHKHGANFNHSPSRNVSPLYIILRNGNITHSKIVDTLLRFGSNFDFRDEIIYDAVRSPCKLKIAHALIRHAAKFHEIKKDDKLFGFLLIEFPDALQDYYHQCRSELNDMKTSYVHHSVSLFNLLTGKIPGFYSKTERVLQAFATDEIKQKYPIYENLLKHLFAEEQEHQKNRDKARQGLASIFRMQEKQLPFVFDNILDFLTHQDIHNLSVI